MALVRLRPLTEAECYARCYGGRHDETVSLTPHYEGEEPFPPALLRALFEIETDQPVTGQEAA